jgi:hypothetical protein
MKIRLNGWQRIGIVVSVVWFIGCAGYTTFIWYNEPQEDILHGRFAEARSLCEQSVKDPLNPDAEFDPSISVRKRCFNQSRSGFAKNMIAIDVGAIVLGWLVAWFGIVITRWIRRGSA